MAKRKSNYIEHDDGTYKSRSSIDNEPKFQDEDDDQDTDKQIPLPSFEQELERLSSQPTERKMKVDLKLVITPAGDKAISIPVLCGEYGSTRVPELLALSLSSRRFKKILEAVLDNPLPQEENLTEAKHEALSGISESITNGQAQHAEAF